jgi:hypothetical protein
LTPGHNLWIDWTVQESFLESFGCDEWS